MSDGNKTRAWELFIRVIAISVAIGGPFVGYQFKRLDDADHASMSDRNQLRERVAVAEERARSGEMDRQEIKRTLIRIESKLDMAATERRERP